MAAGDTLSFSVKPMDRFGNSSAHRDDADVSRFKWRLQMLQKPPIKDSDGDIISTPPPPPEAPTHGFETLEGASVEITESGEYELIVTHTKEEGGIESLDLGNGTRRYFLIGGGVSPTARGSFYSSARRSATTATRRAWPRTGARSLTHRE